MDLSRLLLTAKQIFTKTNAPYALIGAFGMSVYGCQRATNDIDFLVDGKFKLDVEREFLAKGFVIYFSSEEILQLSSEDGNLDIVFANRPLSQQMLGEQNLPEILGVPCLRAEDIIGLKIQAFSNNPKRKLRDLADIQSLAEANMNMDWDRIRKYAEIFESWNELQSIKELVKKDER